MSTDLEATLAQNTPVAATGQLSVAEHIQRQVPALEAALGAETDARRLARIVLTEVRKTPKLAQCTLPSLLGAMMQSAQMRLEPGPVGLAYFVPRPQGKGAERVWNIEWWLGYKGMMELARRSGRVGKIQASPIWEADEFDAEHGTGGRLHHRVDYRTPAAERGDIWGYYAFAELTGGGDQWIVLNRVDVDTYKNRSPSKSASFSPWKSDYDAMAMKTCVRRLFTWLPTGTDYTDAVAADERVLTWDPERPEVPAAPADESLDDLYAAFDAEGAQDVDSDPSAGE